MDEHFTQDEERLGRFVLGSMPEDERLACDRHLQRCEICQQAVREERRLAGGIRRYGRDQMKHRLRAAAGGDHRIAFSWQQVVGVAATIVIIAGAGILYRWWEARGPEPARTISEYRGEEPAPSQQAPSPPVVGDERKAPSVRSDRSAPDDRSAVGGAREKEENAPVRTSPTGTVTARDQGTAAARSREEIGAVNELAAAKPTEAHPEQVDKLGAVSGQQQGLRQTQTFWVQGVPMSTPAHAGPAAALPSDGKKSKDDRNVADAVAKSLQLVRREVPAQDIVVNQRSLSLLPESRQQAAIAQQTIVTEVRDADSTTFLTLYLDTLLGIEQLRDARVRVVNPDSLVVEVGGRIIGYRMPKGWMESRSAKTDITH